MELIKILVIDVAALMLTLGILVTIHEFGHFWVARKCGVKVERFSIGFGKALLRWQRGETEYVIAAIPLGGYVKMLGERDKDFSEDENCRAFSSQALWKRSAIAAAGPIANFLLAIVLFWVMYMVGVSTVAPVVGGVLTDSPAAQSGVVEGDEIVAVDGELTPGWQDVHVALLQRWGENGNLDLRLSNEGRERTVHVPLQDFLSGQSDPNTLQAIGLQQYRLDIPVVIGEIVEQGRAQEAGLQVGDQVLSMNGEPVTGWLSWVDLIRANPENDLLITLQRGDTTEIVSLRPAGNIDEDGVVYGYIGAGVAQPEVWPTLPEWMNREVRYGPLAAIPRALKETWDTTLFILDSFKKMIAGLISIENLAGPVTIAQVAGQTVSSGFEDFIGFLALLSVSLGVFNLLPVPVLDGGLLFYNFIEFVIRRPVPERIQQMGMQLGLLLIVGVTFIVFYNDLNRVL